MKIAIVGGTGKLGSAMARRLLKAGHDITVGSRSPESAKAAAEAMEPAALWASNAEAAAATEIVIVTVPFAAQEATLAEIRPHVAEKIVVDTTVPLVPPKVMRVQLPEQGCAAERTRQLLGEEAIVVSAFHNVAAHKLATDEAIECDVLVFGDDKAARAQVISLAEDMGMRGIHAGALVNSAAAEAMTSLLIFINKTYQVDGAGLQITGELIAPAA